jgi:TolB-like protein/class 3 adenylate cyclase/Tfp pilus assembly protein PilF
LERRLAAILVADVVGYSQLMGADQSGTLDALRQLRDELFDPIVIGHRGNVVKRMGDGWIVEFPSISDAVACAIAIQSGLSGHDIIKLRVGVHTGEVVFEADDVFGEGVNVAARLEALADPGQILVSDTAINSLDKKTTQQFGGGETRELKNIERSVAVWHWPAAQDAVFAIEKMPIALPDKPSIAVLPFNNMSGDAEQEYFADGVVEEIITALSKLSWLFVIARNSSFIYKGQAVEIKQVGLDLGVRYVLEGSIRKAGNKIRITAQLIDAKTGTHLWADRYDGSLDDIFELQDQITSNVVGAIAPRLESAEIARTKHKPTSSLDAYDCYLRGMAAMYKWSPDGVAEALKYFYRAIEIDPEYGIAYAMAARCFNVRAVTSPLEFDADDVEEAERLCRLAADLGRNDAMALSMTGVTLGYAVRDVPGGAALTTRALALNPNLAAAWLNDGWLQQWLGNPKIAIEHVGRAMELSPHDPTIFQMQAALAGAHFTAGDDLKALEWAERALHDRPDNLPSLMWAMVSVAHLGVQIKVEDFRDRIIRGFPGINFSHLENIIPYQQPKHAARLSEGFRKAGFPEEEYVGC